MADPQPTSSQEVVEVTDEGLNPDFVNRLTNKESARFLMRVLQKADEEQKSARSKLHDRLSEFTGFDKQAFTNKSLKTDIQLSDLKEVERSQIHEQLMNSYFIGNVVPTTKVLYHALYEQIPSYVDIRTFRKYLAKYGYVWLRLPNSFGVIERPKVTFERYFYLRDIIKYREEKREIFYVDESIMSVNSGEYYEDKKYRSLKKTAVNAGKELSKKNLVKVTYATSKSGLYGLERIHLTKLNDREFSADVFNEWVLSKLLPILPSSSVVVIKNDKNIKPEKPSLYSTREEMTEWLDSNNVSYDDNMSKCDLVTLINLYTSEVEPYNKIESILNSNGHVLMQLPFSAEKISVAHHVFNLIKINGPKMKEMGKLDDIFDAVSPEQLKAYDEDIAKLEKETLDIDKKVDEILDEIIFRTGTTRSAEYDCDSEVPLSDSD